MPRPHSPPEPRPVLDHTPIADYALIGDMRSTALVARDGSIDWLCLPRHDSPALLLRLLDPEGGASTVEVDGLLSTHRRYLSDTNILETTFVAAAGTLVVRDFMPVRARPGSPAGGPIAEGPDTDAFGAVLRQLRCTDGTVTARLRTRPRFDYARAAAATIRRDAPDAVTFRAGPALLRVAASVPLAVGDDAVEAAFTLREGEAGHLALCGTEADLPAPAALFEETRAYWTGWAGRCRYRGAFRDAVLRSVLCLKLLTYAPTGAIVAAATAGLPEAVGGPRNWDYRFTWLRDASFTVGAFLNLGYEHEAAEFLRFLRGADRSGGTDLRILYPIAGEEVPEQELEHLRGWRGSRPVLIGNAAADQDQHDIYGEFLSALCLFLETVRDEVPDAVRNSLPELVTNLAKAVEQRWNRPDRGIWELRTEPGHFFHSKGMCWLALDGAVKLAGDLGLAAEDRDRWAALRDRIGREVHERAWDEDRQAYVAGYELRELDAAVLRCTLFDANDPHDPRLEKTLRAVEAGLAAGPHVYRYRMDDGLEGDEGAFFACSFWLAGNWALQGRTRMAHDRLAELVACANDVGLLSEEVDPATGELLGNFPQAFSHMALINGLIRLEKAVDRFGLR